MSANNAVLTTVDLSKQFGGFTVLRSASIDVAAGDFLTIFGRNGAGKTTLLKIVAGLTRSYRGSVRVFGSDLKRAGDSPRGRVGFVSHESFLYPDLTVYDNLLFYARLYRIPDTRSAVETTIATMDLEAKSASTVRSLSRGMKQRLSLGRAFLNKPELLLLDEPFTGLDERAAEMIDHTLGEVQAEGRTVVMATHNMERGWKRASRIAVLERGTFVYQSSVGETTFEDFRKRYRETLAG